MNAPLQDIPARYSPIPSKLWGLPTLELAPQLLGLVITRIKDGTLCRGLICEVEAYLSNDPASHSFRGMRPRNHSMFLPAGHAYVYRIYGLHRCFNVVSGPPQIGEAILIRALEPLEGIPQMKFRRGVTDEKLLCSGPARICQALAIDSAEDGIWLQDRASQLYLEKGAHYRETEISTSPRIGISKNCEAPWRFFLKHSRWISRR